MLTAYCRGMPAAIPGTLPHMGNVLADTLKDQNAEAGLKLEVTALLQAALDGLGVPEAAGKLLGDAEAAAFFGPPPMEKRVDQVGL